jgi:hypothetical protein
MMEHTDAESPPGILECFVPKDFAVGLTEGNEDGTKELGGSDQVPTGNEFASASGRQSLNGGEVDIYAQSTRNGSRLILRARHYCSLFFW